MSGITNNPTKRGGRGPGRPPSQNQLLYTRRHAAELLGVSVDKIKELEKLGILDRIRLTPGGDVHLRASQVLALAK